MRVQPVRASQRISPVTTAKSSSTTELKTTTSRLSPTLRKLIQRTPPKYSPLSPVERSLHQLSKLGYRTLPGEAKAIQHSFDNHREALVRVSHRYDSVASLTGQEDLNHAILLAQGKDQDQELTSLYHNLLELERQGVLFYLKRPGERILNTPLRQKAGWIRTSPLFAALCLKRGEAIRAVDLHGNSAQLKSAADLKKFCRHTSTSSPHPQKLEALKVINRLSTLGFEVYPPAELPPHTLQSDYKKMYWQELKDYFLSAFKEIPQYSLPKQHQRLLELLASGKAVPCLKQGDYPFMPLHLNLQQLKTLITYKTSATPEMTEFYRLWCSFKEKHGLLFARLQDGEAKGALVRTDALGAYITLSGGGEVLALNSQGDLTSLHSIEEAMSYLRAPSFQQKDKVDGNNLSPPGHTHPKNLAAVFYNALHSPYDKFGYYDDFPVRLKKLGSNPNTELIIERSDLPHKKVLRLDKLQGHEFQTLQTLSPENVMSDPKVLENFVYNTVKNSTPDEHIRLFIIGHGGADYGLLYDYDPSGQQTSMTVDEFAASISKALDRIEQETGRRPVIDNLILGSCLMGNASLAIALAEKGDVKALSASPELLLDGFPKEMVDYLYKHPESEAREFAEALVNINLKAAGLEGGPSNRKHALVYGAYDLDPHKAARFKNALRNFFRSCTSHPESAPLIKEDILSVPPYNIHPAGGPGIGEEQRDVIAVAQAIAKDSRIRSKEIKQAADSLIEAASSMVWKQASQPTHKHRYGLSLHLPIAGTDDPSPSKFLQETGHREFIAMLRKAPYTPTIQQAAATALYTHHGLQQTEAVEATRPYDPHSQAIEEQSWLHSQESSLPARNKRELLRSTLQEGLKMGAGLIGGIAGAAIGASVGAGLGLLLGARAGLTGTTIYENSTPPTAPSEDKNEPSPPDPPTDKKTLLDTIREHPQIAYPVLLFPIEAAGNLAQAKASRAVGNIIGSALALPLGAIGGLIGGACTGLVLGGITGAQLGSKIADHTFDFSVTAARTNSSRSGPLNGSKE